MQLRSKELKRIARINLTGNYTTPMGAFVLATLIAFMIELPFSYLLNTEYATTTQKVTYYAAEFLIGIISSLLDIGLIYLHLNIARHKKSDKSDIFYCFKNQTERFIICYLIIYIIELICMGPYFIGRYFILDVKNLSTVFTAIVLALISLALSLCAKIILCFVFYTMLDHPQMSLPQCFSYSVKLIKGNYFKTFCLYLSFAGMLILGILSFGIGLLWIQPYFYQTFANYYLSLKKVDYSV